MRAKKSKLKKRHIAKTRKLQKKKKDRLGERLHGLPLRIIYLLKKIGFISTLVLKYVIESFNSPQGFLKK